MAGVTYKRLFEVQVLHDYYLTAKSTSFFSSTLSSAQRRERINDKLIHQLFDIRKDIIFEPTPATKLLLENYRIRFAPTPLGFLVAAEVKSETVGLNTLYKPFISFASDLKLSFRMRLRNRLFQNFSLEKMKRRTPAIYLLDNLNPDADKTDTALSQAITTFDATQTYEMGELVNFAGTIREALFETNQNLPANWRDVDGNGFVNENDRIFFPQRFAYNLSGINNVTEVELTLNKLNGDEVKKYDISSPTPLQKINVDFRQDNADEAIEKGFYNLSLVGNNGFNFQRKLYFDDEVFNSGTFGVIDLHAFTNDANFHLLDNAGFLANAGGVTNYPVFEIRFRSRLSYWRYISKEQFVGPAPNFLDFVPGTNNKVLVSELPKALTQSTTEFNIIPPDPVLKKIYPNPPPTSLKYESDGRIYSDVYINAINRLEN